MQNSPWTCTLLRSSLNILLHFKCFICYYEGVTPDEFEFLHEVIWNHGLQILCLDECTANVDPQTTALLKDTVTRECRHLTVITIAHRISTIIDLDRVLIMEHGKMVWSFQPPSQKILLFEFPIIHPQNKNVVNWVSFLNQKRVCFLDLIIYVWQRIRSRFLTLLFCRSKKVLLVLC